MYRGSRLSQLYGSYLYGDLGSGEIWSLRNSGTNVTQNTTIITDQSAVLSGFGTDPSNDDPLYAALRAGTNSMIKRIIYNSTTNGAPLPPTLADTGAFSDVATLTPAPGVVPYSVNVPFWSDGALKSRWFSVPNTNLTIGFGPTNNWTFPTGTVWIKHFDLQLTNGAPDSNRRIETRLLVKNANGIYGVTYRWGGSLTNAALVPEGGMDEAFVLDAGGGVLRTQTWHYPSWSECQGCHTSAGGFGLGFNTAQLNADLDYGSGPTNEIAALSAAGYFTTAVSDPQALPALAAATNDAVSVETRVRSYLAANCQQCHQPANPVPAHWDARFSTPVAQAGIINGPLVADLGNPDNRVVTPGSLANSVMYLRLADLNGQHMPPLDTTVVNTQAVILLADWITNSLVPPLPPVADFSGSPTNGFAPLTVTFTNLSAGATNWLWDFGDTQTSAAANPVNTYTSPGVYSVTLTAIGAGGTNGLTRTNYIAVVAPPPPVADFSGSPTNGFAPLTVTFTNLSAGATNWLWDFGDTQTSANANPVNTYTSPGVYSVTLTAIGAGGTNSLTRTNYIAVVAPPPVADFSGSPTNGFAPLTVTFTNLSAGATNWLWDFGDTQTSANANPVNTYADPGVYSVTLTATGAGGTNGLTRTNYIVVVAPLPLPVLGLGEPLFDPATGFQFIISNVDSTPISPDQQLRIAIYAATNPVSAFTNWNKLTNAASLTNGLLQFTDPDAALLPLRFYRALEAP